MSAIPVGRQLSSPWRLALPAFAGVVLAILLLYRDTWLTMAGIWWSSETFAHAMLVPPISLWLVWRQRDRLAMLVPRAEPWALLPMLVVCVAWLLADVVAVNAASQFAAVAMLVLAVPLVLGRQVALALLFPLLFLFFAVPFGEFMLPRMMEWTANFTVAALQVTGVPVYREGMHFVIPSGNWSVIDECSGVRYLIASFMVGTLFAYLNYRSYRRRAVFMLVSIVTPIVANWLRAYFIVMLAHLSGNKLAVGLDHILYGWVFFGIVITIMFMVGSRWSEPDDALPASLSAAESLRQRTLAQSLAPALAASALAGVLVVLLPQVGLWGLQRAEGAAEPARLVLPARLAGGWQAADIPAAIDWTPIFEGPSTLVRQAFTGPAGTVGLVVAYYRGQGEGRKLVSSQNVLLGMRDRQWNQLTVGTQEAAADGQAFSVRTAELIDQQSGAGSRKHLVVWRLYWVDGRWIGGDVAAKLAGAAARLQGRGDEGAALVLHADSGSLQASSATLKAFIEGNLPPLNLLLQQVRDKR